MVTKRNDKRYTATLAVGRNPDGSLKRKYFYGKTKKEVDLKIAKAKLDLENASSKSHTNGWMWPIPTSCRIPERPITR